MEFSAVQINTYVLPSYNMQYAAAYYVLTLMPEALLFTTLLQYGEILAYVAFLCTWIFKINETFILHL